jgi:hypothetical protein
MNEVHEEWLGPQTLHPVGLNKGISHTASHSLPTNHLLECFAFCLREPGRRHQNSLSIEVKGTCSTHRNHTIKKFAALVQTNCNIVGLNGRTGWGLNRLPKYRILEGDVVSYTTDI